MSTAPAQHLSDYAIRREGWRALTERLGISGAIRFLMQYDPGESDYTREREGILAGITLDEAVRRMRAAPPSP